MKKISASNDVWERDPERPLLATRSGLNKDSQVRFDARTDGKMVAVFFWRCICWWGDTSDVLHYFSPHVTERIADYCSLRGGGGRNNDLKRRCYNRTASAGKSKTLRQKHMWVPLTTDFVTLARPPWLEPVMQVERLGVVARKDSRRLSVEKEEIPGSICLRVWARRWLAHNLIVKSATLNKSS